MNYKQIADAALAERARLVGELRSVAEDTVLSDAEKRERVERIEAGISQSEAEARSAIEKGEREAEVRALGERAGALVLPGAERRDTEGVTPLVQLRQVAQGDLRSMDLDLQAGLAEARTAQTSVPANAGYLHPSMTFVGDLVKYMRERSAILSLARTLNTSSGEPMEVPRRITVPTSTGPIPENTQITKTDLGLDRVTLSAYKFGVIAEATLELLEDDHVGFASLLAQDIAEVTADRVSQYLMVGTGTNQPLGLVTAATAGVTGVANLAGVGFDELINLQHSVAMPYRRNCVLFTSDALVASLRKKKDTSGAYLWQPSIQAGLPDTVLGMPVYTDPNFATTGAGAKVAVYGDISKYVVRQVRNLTVTRSDEYGFDRDVVAWKVTWRGDGTLLDPNVVKSLTVAA